MESLKIFRVTRRGGKISINSREEDSFRLYVYRKEEHRLRGKSKRGITNFSPSFQPTP